jgi:hypothetical protein
MEEELTYCDLFGDTAECQAEQPQLFVMDDHEEGEEMDEKKGGKDDEEEEPSKGEMSLAEWHAVKYGSMIAMADPMAANITLAVVSGLWAASGALEAFKWRKDYTATKFYAAGTYDTDKIEWWKFSDLARNYGAMGIGGILMLTSVAASLGIMQGLNLMAWGGLGFLAAILQLGVFSLRYLGYVSYHKDSRSNTASLATGGAAMVTVLRNDWIRDELALILTVLAIASSMDAVMLGWWMSMSAEAQNDQWASW